MSPLAVLPKRSCPGVKPASPTSPVELTPRIPEKRDDDAPVLVRRVKRRPDVFAVVLSISSLEFGPAVQIPTLPFPAIRICSVPVSSTPVAE